MQIKSPLIYGGLFSVLIGAPIGIISLFFTFLMPISLFGDGLFLMTASYLLVYPTLSMIIAFIITLWFAGRYAASLLLNNKHLLFVSFQFAAIVNISIWLVFLIALSFVTNWNLAAGLLIFIFAFIIIGTGLCTFSTGLLICYVIKKKVVVAVQEN